MKINGTNMSMTRGDSESITISCTDIDGSDILFSTGDIIYFTIKENTGTLAKIFQSKIETFTNGKAIVLISPEDTANVRVKTYVYDVQWNKANGNVTTIIPPSKFTISEEVTYE